MDNILVSIIIASYNSEKFLAEAIQSVLAQTHQNFEVLIGDDCSTDGNREVMKSLTDPRIQKFYFDTNRGPGAVCHDLISRCRGEYIIRMDADDVISKDRLKLQLGSFAKDPSIVLSIAKVAEMEHDGSKIYYGDNYPSTDAELRAFVDKRHAIPCGGLAIMMYSKKSYDALGGFKKIYARIGGEDYDLFLRLMEIGKIDKIDEYLYFYRRNPNSFSKTMTTDILKLNSHLMAFFLYEQRKHNNGKDSTQGMPASLLDDLIKEIENTYKVDPSKILMHHYKAKHLSVNQRLKASFDAIKLNPLKFRNYRFAVKLLYQKLKLSIH